MLRARSTGTKRQHESPGVEANRRYLDWVASLGDVTGGSCVSPSHSHRRVTFDDENETFEDAREAAKPTAIPLEETVNDEWRKDGYGPLHPSTEHPESRITWRSAPSRIPIGCKEGRYREYYDLDLLAFQAGSYASDEEETTYLESNVDGHLIKGVQLEIPEDDSIPGNTNDKPGQAHTTPAIHAGDLANEPETTNSAPQAAIETSEDNIILADIPEIDFEFREEPTIELTSFY